MLTYKEKVGLKNIVVIIMFFIITIFSACRNISVSVNMLNNRSSMAQNGEALNKTNGGGKIKGNKLK